MFAHLSCSAADAQLDAGAVWLCSFRRAGFGQGVAVQAGTHGASGAVAV